MRRAPNRRTILSNVFDPEAIFEVVRPLVGQPIEQLIPALVDDLAERWPKHIEREARWVLNNAGGAMGSMRFLHTSLTEYLIIFGTPIGTEGHSGRFWADDFFFILDGEQWAYGPGDLQRSVYRPGEMHHLPRGSARGYRIPEHCWALEYARGIIPGMLPFGFADTFTSTLDFPTMMQTLGIYGRGCVRQLLRGKV
jgi:C-8 sterol isomerase